MHLCLRVYVVAIAILASIPLTAQVVHVWDLADVTQPGQLTIYNPDFADAEFGTPIRSGDLNADGFDDFVVSAMAGDGPDNRRANAGEVAVWFSPGHFPGPIDLADSPANVVTIFGERPRDIFGIKTEVADVDGDGQNDLLVGAFYADGAIGLDSGKLYVISGRLLTNLLAAGANLDLASEWPDGVAAYSGPDARARLGVWVAAGDVDGDGRQDIVAGADQADGGGGASETGQVWVLPGPVLMQGATTDLSTFPTGAKVIFGADPVDHLGSTVVCADVDGDGFDDVVAGAAAFGTLRNAYDRAGGAGDGPDNDRPEAGELWVIFGDPALPAVTDLAMPPESAMVMYGADGGGNSPDRLGEEIVAADVNGDQVMDLIVGAYRADGPDNARPDAGDSYIVFGSAGLRGRIIDMATAPADVITIYGAVDGAISGDSIAGGDIHGDGYDDVFIGVPGDAGPLGRRLSGGIVVIAGGPELPHEIDLAAPSVPVVWIQAPDDVDFSAYWSAAGDIDGDGHIDVMPNGMAGDGPDNERNNAGEAHAVSGAMLATWLAPVATAVTTQPATPAQFHLGHGYPNPFNSGVTIPFSLDAAVSVELSVYNLAGQRVVRLLGGQLLAGTHRVTWDGLDDAGHATATGMYVARLTVPGQQLSTRLLLLR